MRNLKNPPARYKFYKFSQQLLVFWLLIIGLNACRGGGGPLPSVVVPPSSAKVISSYALNGTLGLINGQNISVIMPYGSDLQHLVATFACSGIGLSLANVKQISGQTANDFTRPQSYTVTAADGSTAQYVVTVSVAASSAKAITSYSLAGTPGLISGRKILVTLPFKSDPRKLIATFTTSGVGVSVANIPQLSGQTINDFCQPLPYTVTAADGSTAVYLVVVKVAESSAKAISAYSLNGIPGLIIGNVILVRMPYPSDLTNLIASFTTSAKQVKVANVNQVSGQTANNFTQPLNYTLSAANGSSTVYAVNVIVAPSSSKAILTFSLNGVSADIHGQGITLEMPFGQDIHHLIATFSSSGTQVSIASVPQVSGQTSNDFSQPLTYTVTAADGTSADYLVSVTVLIPHWGSIANPGDPVITAVAIGATASLLIGNSGGQVYQWNFGAPAFFYVTKFSWDSEAISSMAFGSDTGYVYATTDAILGGDMWRFDPRSLDLLHLGSSGALEGGLYSSNYYNGIIYSGDAEGNLYRDGREVCGWGFTKSATVNGLAGDKQNNLYMALGNNSGDGGDGYLYRCPNPDQLSCYNGNAGNCTLIDSGSAATSLTSDDDGNIYVAWNSGNVIKYSNQGQQARLIYNSVNNYGLKQQVVYDSYHQQLIVKNGNPAVNQLLTLDPSGKPMAMQLPPIPSNLGIPFLAVDNSHGIIYAIDYASRIFYLQY